MIQIIKVQTKLTHHNNLFQTVKEQYKEKVVMSGQLNNQQNDNLSAEQYESVLKYMQITNEDDFDRSVQMLKAHGFALQNAINTRLSDDTNMHNTNVQSQGSTRANNRPNDGPNQNRDTRGQEDIRRYVQYLREKQNKSTFVGIFNFTKNFVIGLFKGITQFILPQFVLKKIMRSQFYNLYSSQILPEFSDKKLSSHLGSAYLSRKPIMFVISAPQTVHQCFLNLFNNQKIVRKINESFIFAGAISNEKQCSQIQGEKQPPSIIICRKNLIEKIEIVRRFVGQQEISRIDIDRLNYTLRDHQRATRKDKNILVKYRNYVRRTYFGGRPGYYQQQEEEQQLYYQPHSVASDMIKKQNQQYKKMQEQTRRKQSLQLLEKQKKIEHERKLSQIVQQRKVRKMSIPQQPLQGDQIVRINFRCPDGSSKSRNFYTNQKVDLIYHWVETNQQIEFEDNNKKQFELMHGFPPVSLSNRREEFLKDVFQSDQQKIMIREL